MRFLVALCALSIFPCFAGDLRLLVVDPSGAPMHASGKLLNSAGSARVFETDAQGAFTFPALQAGRYRLQVSGPGFVMQTTLIDVPADAAVARTIRMALAEAQSKVDVVATMPLPGVERSIDRIAAPVQTATAADIEKSGALDLPAFLNRRMNGVYLNEMQGNPYQPDVNFRGYTASPLLGTPQGISVYLDGVRQNQPFGDVVSWDLIPQNAIASATLLAGSDPVFGLNTLGGALSLQTKDGVANPGLSGHATYGSSGRKAIQAEEGGRTARGFDWFLAANAFHESGWRFDSPSDVRQGFGRFGWRNTRTSVALTAAYAYNTLTGNGLQDDRLLARDYSSAYTVPDTIGNRSPAVNLIARHALTDAISFSANASFRNIRTEGVNGNLNNNSLDQSVYQPSATDIAALAAAGYTGYPTSGANAANTPFPKWRCIAQSLEKVTPANRCDGLTVYSKSVQNEYGLSAQSTITNARNQLTAGGGFDRGSVGYTQASQFGYLNPNGSVTGVNDFAEDARVHLHGLTPNWSLFAADTLNLRPNLALTLAARFNRSTVSNSDYLNPGGGPGSLDGHDVYSRLNPSVGATWSPFESVNAYASFTQGSRAPTSIELGCADPVNPCSLPNALASDPPLRQVVTGTWEAGLRGKPGHGLKWNAGAFRAENRDDILFVASRQTGSGYFSNFGRTRREGWQAGLDLSAGHLTGGVDYSFVEATYQSTETVEGNANSTNDGGVITVHPGNRIPLVPKQTGKIFADYAPFPKLGIDADFIAVSSSYARGNENNAFRSDEKYYLGTGISPGYGVVNLRAHYDVTRRLQLSAQVDNLLDRHYDTAAQLANTGFNAQGAFVARPFPQVAGNYPVLSTTFFAPGAPRRAWVELRVRF